MKYTSGIVLLALIEIVISPQPRRYRLRELYQLRNPKSEAEKDHLPDGVIPTLDFLRTHDPDWPR